MARIPHETIVPDVANILTAEGFEKAIRGSFERVAADAARAHPPAPRPRRSAAVAVLVRLRRIAARGVGALRARRHRNRG